MSLRRVLTFAIATILAAQAARAQCLIRVPEDVADLQQAIQQVCDGGVIVLAPGVYPSPPEGFRIANLAKSFTIRSDDAGRAILDGGGSRLVLRLENSDRSRGRLVVFERLTFRGGRSTLEGRGGAVTVIAGEARFLDCRFENNVAAPPGTGGGGALVRLGSSVEIDGGRFKGNSSPNRGGALEVLESEVTIQGTDFIANQVNVLGHSAASAGGAIYALDAALQVSDALFQRNQAGWVGGAIYAFGRWGQPLRVPRTLVQVARSSFLNNRAEPHPCCPVLGLTTGGALHAEDHATMTVSGSRFEGNRAFFGGAVSSFRAIVEIAGSAFADNRAEEPGENPGVGGAVSSLSSDPPGEAANRRPAELAITRSIFQGRANDAAAAATGGCVLAAGDVGRFQASGAAGANRSRVRIKGSAFAGCDATATGGALTGELVDLVLDDSLVLDSWAGTPTSPAGAGGGLNLAVASAVRGSGTSFAGNRATMRGGALHARAIDLELDAVRFLDNTVDGGTLGAAIFTTDAGDDPMTGTVADSLFANDGIDIRDVESPGAAANQMRYLDNRFFANDNGGKVYGHNLDAPNGTDVPGLNELPQGDGNVRIFSRPAEGDLVLVPPAGSPGKRTPALLAYAWSGNVAFLEGPGVEAAARATLGLQRRFGVARAGKPGVYSLIVDGQKVASVTFAKKPAAGSASSDFSGLFDRTGFQP